MLEIVSDVAVVVVVMLRTKHFIMFCAVVIHRYLGALSYTLNSTVHTYVLIYLLCNSIVLKHFHWHIVNLLIPIYTLFTMCHASTHKFYKADLGVNVRVGDPQTALTKELKCTFDL